MDFVRNEKGHLEKMGFKEDMRQRMDIIKATSEETLNRLKEVTGGKFEARFGAAHEKWTPERNLMYVTSPFQDLIDQYHAKVDNCQHEIDDAHTML